MGTRDKAGQRSKKCKSWRAVNLNASFSSRVIRRFHRFCKDTGTALHGLANSPEKVACCFGRLPAISLPDFISLGAQKAGSSWLMANLNRHPDICLPQGIKHWDIHYFDRHFAKPLGFYSKFFANPNGKKTGENTPAYGLLPNWKIRFIQKLLPDVRLLFMMRNPVERAWSHALMNFMTDKKREFDSISDSEFLKHFNMSRSRDRGDYLTILNRWESVYSPEQFTVGFFDQIESDPQRLLTEMFVGIDVTTEVDWDSFKLNEIVNKGAGISIPNRLRTELEKIYRDPIEKLYDRFGDPVAAWRIEN